MQKTVGIVAFILGAALAKFYSDEIHDFFVNLPIRGRLLLALMIGVALLAAYLKIKWKLPAVLFVSYQFWLWLYLLSTDQTEDVDRWVVLALVVPFGLAATALGIVWAKRDR